ncbi:hypothetical protein SPRG_02341 [Saprolegnia parasitica CBS 223.65]|uniref:Uncharacterized protein n=1 Tax=Saprolegnia parasitica (strain CBS 223.65) TaxID=695850 RepID=A0A067CTS0_SAPPC|nr:hypothetical protein SPRG_02341 [Saprolegnia parasitica CBS 223.65]KDO32640.1 hypothetical protein SPRG_02341 [Saprolegnia parasitica CBS 223.65]|eukprot:XP_012196307.1 hypothetical protein SPRG_02341 [Saprolegnia parasitica CBS 223.65]
MASEHLRVVTEAVLRTPELPEPPVPEPPKWKAKGSIKTKLHAVQTYLNALEYNYTGKLYFNVNKHRSYKSIYGTAKEIMAEALPIQCLEAVFVAAYLTAHGMPEYEGMNPSHQIERVPISFKSTSGGSVFRHIVLGVKHQHLWGALGLSRNPSLMNKDLKYKHFSELLADYVENFSKCHHTVTKIYVGFPFSHDIHSSEKVQWRVLNIKISEHPWDAVAGQFDLFLRESSEIMSHLHRVGELPESFADKYPLHKPPKKGSHPRSHHRSSESEGFGQQDDGEASPPVTLDEPMAPVVDTRLVLLRPAPASIVFKRLASTSTDLVAFQPANIYLHNESPFVLQVDVTPGAYLLVVGKPLIKTQGDIKLDQPYCRFVLQPRSIASVGLRFVLPTAADESAKKAALGMSYVALDPVQHNAPVVDDQIAQTTHLTASLSYPYEWD